MLGKELAVPCFSSSADGAALRALDFTTDVPILEQ